LDQLYEGNGDTDFYRGVPTNVIFAQSLLFYAYQGIEVIASLNSQMEQDPAKALK
jgi:hypothetical protein